MDYQRELYFTGPGRTIGTFAPLDHPCQASPAGIASLQAAAHPQSSQPRCSSQASAAAMVPEALGRIV
jgi:hypothetical protein